MRYQGISCENLQLKGRQDIKLVHHCFVHCFYCLVGIFLLSFVHSYKKTHLGPYKQVLFGTFIYNKVINAVVCGISL